MNAFSLDDAVARLANAAQATHGVDIAFDSKPEHPDRAAIGSAIHPVSGRRSNVIRKGDVIFIQDFRSNVEAYSIRLSQPAKRIQHVANLPQAASTDLSLSVAQAFSEVCSVPFSAPSDALLEAIARKRGWTVQQVRDLSSAGLIRPVSFHQIDFDDASKGFHSIACEMLAAAERNADALFGYGEALKRINHFGLFIGGLHTSYQMGYAVPYRPLTSDAALAACVTKLEVRGISANGADPIDEDQGSRVATALNIHHNLPLALTADFGNAANVFLVEAAAKAITVAQHFHTVAVGLNSISDFQKLMQSEAAVQRMAELSAGKRLVVVLDPVSADRSDVQKELASNLSQTFLQAGIEAVVLVPGGSKSIDDVLQARIINPRATADLQLAGLSQQDALALSHCKLIASTKTLPVADFSNATCFQDNLTLLAKAHHDAESRAQGFGLAVQTIQTLSDAEATSKDGRFIYVRDVSGTGVGKSHNAAEVAILAAQGRLGRDTELKRAMQDNKILYTVGTYDTIPTALLESEHVKLVRGRTNKWKAIVATPTGRVLMDEAEAGVAEGEIVQWLEPNCDQYTQLEKVRRTEGNVAAGQFCRGCSKRKSCEYVNTLAELRSGEYEQHVIVTANANRENVLQAMAKSNVKAMEQVKVVMIDDDLNLLRDSEERSLNELIDSAINVSAASLEGAVMDSVRGAVSKMQYMLRPFHTGAQVPDGFELLEPCGDMPKALDKQWLRSAKSGNNVYLQTSLDSRQFFMDAVMEALQQYSVTHSLSLSTNADAVIEHVIGTLMHNANSFDSVLPILKALFSPDMANLAKINYVADRLDISEVMLPIIPKGMREAEAATLRQEIAFLGDAEKSLTFQTMLAERLESKVSSYVRATRYDFRKVDVKVLMCKTNPELFRSHAAAVIQLSADEQWDSYKVYGKYPDAIVRREPLSQIKPKALVIDSVAAPKFFRADQAGRAANYYKLRQIVAVAAAQQAGLAVPAELRTAIFTDKHTKDTFNGAVEGFTLQQYFGDEVGKNKLYTQNVNCILAFPQKDLNIGVANLTSGVNAIDRIQMHEDMDGRTVWSTNDYANIYARSTQLNQAYGRLRANRQSDASLFVAFGSEVYLDPDRFDIVRSSGLAELNFGWDKEQPVTIFHKQEAAKVVAITAALLRSELAEGTVTDWYDEIRGICSRKWFGDNVCHYNATGAKKAVISRNEVVLSCVKLLNYFGDAHWNYTSFEEVIDRIDSQDLLAVMQLLSRNYAALDTIFCNFDDVTAQIELVGVTCVESNYLEGASGPLGQPECHSEVPAELSSSVIQVVPCPQLQAASVCAAEFEDLQSCYIEDTQRNFENGIVAVDAPVEEVHPPLPTTQRAECVAAQPIDLNGHNMQTPETYRVEIDKHIAAINQMPLELDAEKWDALYDKVAGDYLDARDNGELGPNGYQEVWQAMRKRADLRDSALWLNQMNNEGDNYYRKNSSITSRNWYPAHEPIAACDKTFFWDAKMELDMPRTLGEKIAEITYHPGIGALVMCIPHQYREHLGAFGQDASVWDTRNDESYIYFHLAGWGLNDSMVERFLGSLGIRSRVAWQLERGKINIHVNGSQQCLGLCK